MNVAIACGGTGGHIFPGLAVAECLRGRGHHVVLWLAGRHVERMSVADWDGEVVCVPAAGFSGGFSWRHLGVAPRLMGATARCIVRMHRRRPDVVLAMGSYASVGPVLAARLHRVPVVLHEANAVPGRAVTFLARFAQVVAIAFEAAAPAVGAKAVLTGLPLRFGLTPRFPSDALSRDVFTLLIMGGSQGAHALNEIASQAVCTLHASGRAVQAVHLTGPADEEVVRTRYEEAGVAHLVYPFLSDMGLAYGAADLAVSRAGAASCVELAACGVPALLVPLPSAARNHQAANARAITAGGGADTMAQADLSVAGLAAYVEGCLSDPARLKRMRKAMKTLAVRDGAERLASVVERTGRGASSAATPA